MARERYELVIRRGGEVVERVHTHLDPDQEAELRAHLLAALARYVGRSASRPTDTASDLGRYPMAVHRPGRVNPEFVYVSLPRPSDPISRKDS